MAISQVSLTDFRNLKSTTLEFDPGINLIYGGNGSGKTSLLEAIYVLCQAQSFRTHQLKQCINHEKNGFLLFGRFDDHKAGLAKDDNRLEIRLDGEVVKRRSDLARHSPINIVNADKFVLVEGAPTKRRAFLDWCLFHVEHDYVEIWSKFRHALKQRNRLLKNRRDLDLLDYWDQHLIEPSIQLAGMRSKYSRILQQIIEIEFSTLLTDVPVTISYQQGWREDSNLSDLFKQQRQRDIRSGFTNIGVHRDDLAVKSVNKRAADVLSRGQTKRLCIAMLLAGLKLVGSASPNRIILLIDDLYSELDNEARELVFQQLLRLDLQLFISNIEKVLPRSLERKEFKMFHVEHGIIKPRNFG